MRTAASAFPNSIAAELEGVGPRSASAVAPSSGSAGIPWRSRSLSYALGAAVLLIYAYAGTIPLTIPAAFFLSGATLIGIFAVLSETHVNDRFEDHFLTVYQVGAHVVIQLGFLLAAPEIGYAFLNVLFLIFAVASLRMTSLSGADRLDHHGFGRRPDFSPDPDSDRHADRDADRTLRGSRSASLRPSDNARSSGFTASRCARSCTSSGLKLKEAYRRIEELAELDELTGSYNRRCIMRMLGEEIARARRIESPCSIALIDLDWFKRINDAYGHPTGDEVLRTFAITMFANIRTIDRFGRYGGEEFLLVLPDTPNDGAAQHSRTAARDHCRSRLERVLARHAGDDFRWRRDAATGRDAGYISRARRQRALLGQGTGTQQNRLRLIQSFFVPEAEKPSPA